jgi:hypothetical protein
MVNEALKTETEIIEYWNQELIEDEVAENTYWESYFAYDYDRL